MKLLKIFLLSIFIVGCYSQSWVSLAGSLATTIVGLHNWSDGMAYNLMGYSCKAQIKGRFHRLKWVYDGKFICPSWTPLVGESRHLMSKNGATEHAIRDFVNKAFQSNLITSDQAAQLAVGKY